MNTLQALITTTVLAMATPAASEVLQVLSGEHADFSRLVIEQNTKRSWSVESFPDHAIITVAGDDLIFEFASVFDLIPRTRIASVESMQLEGGAGLKITFACACHVESFETGSNDIVADVKAGGSSDSADGAKTAFNRNSSVPGGATIEDRAPVDPASLFAASMIDLPEVPEGLIPLPAIEAASREGDQDQETTVLSAAAESPPPDEQRRQSEAVEAAVASAQSALLEQLTRSVDQGIIELADGPASEPAAAENAIVPQDDRREAAAALAAASGDQLAETVDVASDGNDASSNNQADDQLAAQSVFDRDSPPESLVVPATGDPQCWPDAALDVASWADDRAFTVQLAELNAKILGEFDQPNPQAVEKLVRFYVHFGFGTEALNAIREFGADLPDRVLLEEMAHIVDQIPFDSGNSVLDGLSCENSTALWSFLAQGAAGALDEGRSQMLLNNFADLPIDLRRLLGPRLGSLFLAAGETVFAGKVLLIVTRGAGEHGPELDLFQARLEQANGNIEAALEILARLAISNADVATDATVLYAGLLLETAAEIPAGLAADVSAKAVLYQNTSLGRNLRIAEIRLKAGSNALSEALEIYRSEINNISVPDGDDRRVLAELFLTAHWQGAAAEDYAAAVLMNLDLLGSGQDFRAARLETAANFRRIGFPREAVQLLMPLLEEQDPAALLEAAAATLDLSEPEAALGYLSALDSLPATAVRRRALVALGSNSESQDESVSSDNLAWSLGDWRTAAAVDDGPFQALANLMVGGPAAVSDRVVATADVQSSENTTSVAGAGDSPDSADAAGANTLAAARITISIAQTAKKVMEAALESTILD